MAFAIACGAVIKTIPSTIEDGFALPPMEKFEELITPRTKAVLICNPNNPTGYLYTRKEMNQMRDLVKNMTCSCSQMKCIVNSVIRELLTSLPSI